MYFAVFLVSKLFDYGEYPFYTMITMNIIISKMLASVAILFANDQNIESMGNLK